MCWPGVAVLPEPLPRHLGTHEGAIGLPGVSPDRERDLRMTDETQGSDR
jgi:hypothetical protein